MRTLFVAAAALLGLIGVAFGAFGAHALKAVISGDHLEVWKTAVSYQLYHTPVLLALALLLGTDFSRRLIVAAGLCMIVGAVIFSASLYGLVWFNAPRLGMVTPLGGALLMLGWLLLLLAALKQLGRDTH